MDSTIAVSIDDKYLKDSEKKGKKIYKKNKDLRVITDIMERPEFMEVYNKYFNNWSDVKTYVMFMKIYGEITKRVPNLNGYQKLSILTDIIDNTNTRKVTCDTMHNFINDDKPYLGD